MNKKLAGTLTGILLLFCLPKVLTAQERFVASQSKLLTKFPFKMLTGGIIIFQATLDNYADSLNFVLDTGSGGISLDSATVSYFNLKITPSARTIRGIAGMRTVDFALNHTLNIPRLKIDSLDFHINDYDLLTSVYGLKIDGIVGYSFFKRFIVSINYDTQEIEVYTPGSFIYKRGGFFLRPTFTNLPMQNIAIKDSKSILGRFYMDTGAGLCMLFSQDFAEDSNFLSKRRKLYPTQAEGLGGKKNMMLTVMKEVKVGPYRFHKVPVYIFDDEFNVTNYPVLGGLIGNDILRRFNVIFNYSEQLVYLTPNNHFNDVFDYSYTGLGMYVIDGRIKVIDIIKDSPADKAGFKTDDIIISVGNNLSNDIQVYKSLLQNSRTRQQIVVLRNGQPKLLSLNIKSILQR